MRITARITYKVKSVKQERYYLQTQYTSMDISIVQADGKEVNFRSDKSTDDFQSNFFYEMCRTPFYITISSTGEIISVEGIDRMVDNGLKGVDLPKEKVAQIKESMTEAYGEKSFKGNFEIVTLIYPKMAVDINDSWNSETAIYSKQIQAKLQTNFRLVQADERFLHIEGVSEMISNENTESMKLLGSSNLNISLNKDSGWIHSAKVDQIIRIGNKEDANYSFTKMKTTYSDQ